MDVAVVVVGLVFVDDCATVEVGVVCKAKSTNLFLVYKIFEIYERDLVKRIFLKCKFFDENFQLIFSLKNADD